MVSQMDSLNHSILPMTPKMWCHTLKEKGAHKIHKCSWSKGRTKARGSTKTHKALLVNYTLGIEIGALVPVLLYNHTTVGFGWRGKMKRKRKEEKERKKEGKRDHQSWFQSQAPKLQLSSKISECCLPLEIWLMACCQDVNYSQVTSASN